VWKRAQYAAVLRGIFCNIAGIDTRLPYLLRLLIPPGHTPMSNVLVGPFPMENIVRFFALRPDGDALESLQRVRDAQCARYGLRSPVARDNLHLTLCDGGKPARLREPYERAMLKAGSGQNVRTFDLVLNRLLRFHGRGGEPCLVLGADENSAAPLRALRHDLAISQLFNGLVVLGVKSFAPHVTLAYGSNLPTLDQEIEPIVWRVSEFTLIASHQGQSRHEELGRWPLG
jgi:2'-5' RNA ligase